jgi:hypothetical protein
MTNRKPRSKSNSSLFRRTPATTLPQSATSIPDFDLVPISTSPRPDYPPESSLSPFASYNLASQQDNASTNMLFKYPVPLSQLGNSSSRNQPWPIADLLPAGLCLLSAKAHSGSLNLALQLALSSLFPTDRPFNILRKRTLLHHLNRLAHDHHLAILILHSQARHVSTDPFDAIPCSPLLLDTFETLAVLEHDRSEDQATLHLTGRTLQTRSLSLALNTNSWRLDTSPTHASITPERLAILRAIEHADHPLKPVEIATALNKEAGTIRRLLFTMVRAGQVVVQEDGRYLTPLPPTPVHLLAPSMPYSLQELADDDENACITSASTQSCDSSVTLTPSSSLPGGTSTVTNPIPAPDNASQRGDVTKGGRTYC